MVSQEVARQDYRQSAIGGIASHTEREGFKVCPAELRSVGGHRRFMYVAGSIILSSSAACLSSRIGYINLVRRNILGRSSEHATRHRIRLIPTQSQGRYQPRT